MINRSLVQILISPIIAFLLFSAGCVPLPAPEQPAGQDQPPTSGERESSPLSPADAGPDLGKNDVCSQTLDPQKILISERERDQCYHLQPGAVTTKKKGHRASVGRCQPQSLIYARCRTGVTTCRMGDTSPVQWYSCAKKNGSTTHIPTAGSIMVLDTNHNRRMSTGHPVYVEQVKANGNGTWDLRISHTNYDRKCHLDLDAKVLFDPAHMTASFKSGPWSCWACDLKVLGFILR
jgi:hypothetical protein